MVMISSSLGKGFLTNTATAPHGEFVPPEHQDRVYDLKDLPCPLERVCKFFVNNNGRCHRKVCDDVHIQISGRARKEYMERMRESKVCVLVYLLAVWEYMFVHVCSPQLSS